MDNKLQPRLQVQAQSKPAKQREVLPPNVVCYEVDGSPIQLSDMDVLNNILDKKTASIVQPFEVIHFIQQCKAQGLNPFVRDAWLIKYDAGSPAQIVTSCASLEKRAEDFPSYAGMKSGVIVYNRESGEITEREGTLVIKQIEDLVGGWAEVYRKNRSFPARATVNLDEYTTGKSIWKTKPAVMIRKCAKAMALREAFPKQNANLYDSDEISAPANTMAEPDSQRALETNVFVNDQYSTQPVYEDHQTGEIVENNDDFNPFE